MKNKLVKRTKAAWRWGNETGLRTWRRSGSDFIVSRPESREEKKENRSGWTKARPWGKRSREMRLPILTGRRRERKKLKMNQKCAG